MNEPYPETKDSGVEWLGKVPKHWNLLRLKMATTLADQKVEPDEENPLSYIGLENIESWTGRLSAPDPDMIPTGISHVFKPGQVLFGKLRPYLAKACIPDFEGLCSTELLVLESQIFEQRALLYLLLSDGFINLVDSSTYGTKMPRASWDFVGNCVFPVPPLAEQQLIAAFLDRETAKIDTLLAKKRALIALLREQRAAEISQAVTRGLNPDAELKDNGVEWLGKVPLHWEVKRLKFLIGEALKYGANEIAELEDPDLPRYVRITDIDEMGNLRDETLRSLPLEVAIHYFLREGDLLFARSGATAGKTFLYRDSWGKCAYAGYLIRARLNHKKVFPDFARYFTASTNYWAWLSSSIIQATIQNVSAEKYADLILTLPPLEEQVAIAAYLDRETAKIDRLVSRVEAAIAKLQELRVALITAAVTGKIDVRAAA